MLDIFGWLPRKVLRLGQHYIVQQEVHHRHWLVVSEGRIDTVTSGR